MCYTGDVFQGELGARGRDYKYKLDYYLNLARQFVDAGAHVLSVKDMAGLLSPQSTDMLISALRKEFPQVRYYCYFFRAAASLIFSRQCMPSISLYVTPSCWFNLPTICLCRCPSTCTRTTPPARA